ncbi:MAG: hypothetical protein RML72_06145 [Bacteroidia bacterium]|nr:hypothetical protein [Bacteroidia bacterium]MDW8158441.1 hypothetical protein [Bacteroidia bacterium]
MSRHIYFIYLLEFLICFYAETFSSFKEVLAQTSKSVDYENVAILWRGFRHSWQYNHRLHRLGDMPQTIKCDPSGCNATFLHTGSAASEQDVAEFQSYYSILFSNKVQFIQGQDSLILTGKEGEICRAEKTIRVPLPASLPFQEKYSVILNGFDLIAMDEAENMQIFSIEVSDAFIAENSLEFIATGALQAECTGGGCKFSNTITQYLLRFNYILLIGGNSYSATTAILNRNVYWDTKHMPEPEIPRQSIKGDTLRSYPQAVPAFQKIEFKLDRPHFFVALHAALHPENYQKGSLTLRPDLFFFQWEEEMKKKKGRKKSGVLQITVQIVLLQFEEACIKHEDWSGYYSWRQLKAPATDEAATYTSKMSFPKVCD